MTDREQTKTVSIGNRKIGGGNPILIDHYSHMSPAIEGVQQTHGRFLLLRRARLHDRAHQNLKQAASDGIEDNRRHQTGITVRHEPGQERHSDQPRRGQ